MEFASSGNAAFVDDRFEYLEADEIHRSLN
jgi:hypothetical protein